MAHEFKPGDLALVIRSRNEENLGRTVSIVQWAPAGSLIPHEAGFTECSNDCWEVLGEVVTSGPLYPAEKSIVSRHAFPPRSLMPLKGDEQPEQVRQAERVQ